MNERSPIAIDLVQEAEHPDVIATFERLNARRAKTGGDVSAKGVVIGNIHRTVANSPSVFKAFVSMADALRNETQIDPAERELAILCALDLHGDDYEIKPHRMLARMAGLSEPEIENVADPESPVYNDRQRAILRFAKLLATSPSERWSRPDPHIQDYLDNRGLIELALNVSCYIGFARLTDVLDIPREAAYQ